MLVRLLCALESRFPFMLATLSGGTARNALPREASAVIAFHAEHAQALHDAVAEWQTTFSQELQGVDDNMRIAITPAQADAALSVTDQTCWLHTLRAAPHGVKRMSVAMPDNVETSNNIGMVDLNPHECYCNFMVRSTVDSACHALADEIVSLFALSGTAVEKAGYYPGWTPNLKSKLLALCQDVYAKEFSELSSTQVIHAGLECGIIGAKYPNMDMVSFGPTIHNPHAPGESVDIETVKKSWQLLKAILKTLTQST